MRAESPESTDCVAYFKIDGTPVLWSTVNEIERLYGRNPYRQEEILVVTPTPTIKESLLKRSIAHIRTLAENLNNKVKSLPTFLPTKGHTRFSH